MVWYSIVLMSFLALALIVLLFLIYKAIGGHLVGWDGGFRGFLQALGFVACEYAIKWHLKRPKTLPLREQLDEAENQENRNEKEDQGTHWLYSLSKERYEEIIREAKAREDQLIVEEKILDDENLFHEIGTLRIKNIFPINTDLGSPLKRLAIYYEPSYNEPINNYIKTHYDEMSQLFSPDNITFVYIPRMLEEIRDSIHYNNPDAIISALNNSYSIESFYSMIADNFVNYSAEQPLLLLTDYYNTAEYPQRELGDSLCCLFIELEYKDDVQFSYILHKHARKLNRGGKYYQISNSEKDDNYADCREFNVITKEIQARINQLYAMGVSEYVIRHIVSLPEPKLSPLTITDDFRILLPDYKNMEITMPTLSKVLFFFYLRHPEGVLFKNLRDHKAELFELYRTISPLEDIEKMERSIEDIIDSTKNSVNEKCSRIKAAFVSRFNDRLAKEYYITGGAGEPKRIALDRSLVQDKSGIIK